MKLTEQKQSNFINCKGGYFNKGKYKGKKVIKTPLQYLLWMQDNFTNLNVTETKLLSSTIKNKLKNTL